MAESDCNQTRLSRRALFRAGAALGLCGAGIVGLAPPRTARAEAAAANPMAPVALPAQVPAREAVAELPGVRLWFWDTGGTGTPIVLLHPASGSALIWGYQQPVFAKAGYRVIAYSRRGYYNSAPLERDKPSFGSEDLRQLVDVLGIRRFHVVASAAGGSIAADFALSYPDRLLSLTNSSNSFGLRAGPIAEAAASIRPKMWNDIPPDVRELGPSYRALNPDGVKQWIGLEHKALVAGEARQMLKNEMTEAKLAELKMPTLLIAGAADLITPPSISRMIAAKIPGSQLVVASEAGHSVYWEQPDLLNRAVLDFIGKQPK